MSRFVSPDLSKLPLADLVDLPDFQTGLDERIAAFETRAQAVGIEYNTGQLLTDPIRLDQEVSMDREVSLIARVNDAGRAVMLATSWGSNLDHIAATYYGISRRAGELDDVFKLRIALAPEAFSTAGPEGAYVFHALEADGRLAVSDAAAYSEEDGAHYLNGDPVLAPEILVVLVPHPVWLETQDAWVDDAPLLEIAAQFVSKDEVRPLGDKVTVMVAQRETYSVVAALKFAPGADVSLAVTQAEENVRTYAASQRRVGAVVERLGLGAALKVAGVSSITLTSPPVDVDGGSLACPDLVDITITAETVAEGWR